MDYYLLTDMAAQIGYELAVSGAETFRIEETMRRVLAAYGIVCETFAIPNCVMSTPAVKSTVRTYVSPSFSSQLRHGQP